MAMTSDVPMRRAEPGDAAACAAILQDWLDETPWMPDLHDLAATTAWMHGDLFRRSVVTLAEPKGIAGYLARMPDGEIASFTVARGWRGRGIGTALLARAKAEAPSGLTLWTFQANAGARAFYAREGFGELRRTDGDNDEGLPDVQLGWPAPAEALAERRGATQ